MSHQHPQHPAYRIVLAEDGPHDAELTLNALRTGNFIDEVLHVRDGAETLDYLHRRGRYAAHAPGHPSLVLLDLKLPKIDGMEVLDRIKRDANLSAIPVVILTSSREHRDVRAAYRLGANAYVVKPMKLREFGDAIRQIAIFWTMINEPTPDSATRAPR